MISFVLYLCLFLLLLQSLFSFFFPGRFSVISSIKLPLPWLSVRRLRLLVSPLHAEFGLVRVTERVGLLKCHGSRHGIFPYSGVQFPGRRLRRFASSPVAFRPRRRPVALAFPSPTPPRRGSIKAIVMYICRHTHPSPLSSLCFRFPVTRPVTSSNHTIVSPCNMDFQSSRLSARSFAFYLYGIVYLFLSVCLCPKRFTLSIVLPVALAKPRLPCLDAPVP